MYILLDIGGTKTRIASSLDHKSLSNPIIIPTSLDFPTAIQNITQAATALSKGQKIEALAGGVKSLDPSKTTLMKQPNFPLWVGLPLKAELEKALNTKVFLENDAAMNALAEANTPETQNFRIVAFMTISTGVGGCRIVDKEIDRSSLGFEVGLQIINEDKDLEFFVSGSGIEKKYGKKAETIDDERIWDEVANHLAIGLNNLIVFWSPDIVVLGGSVMNKISIERVEFYLKQKLTIYPKLPGIIKSTLGDISGLTGSLFYLNQLKI